MVLRVFAEDTYRERPIERRGRALTRHISERQA